MLTCGVNGQFRVELDSTFLPCLFVLSVEGACLLLCVVSLRDDWTAHVAYPGWRLADSDTGWGWMFLLAGGGMQPTGTEEWLEKRCQVSGSCFGVCCRVQ